MALWATGQLFVVQTQGLSSWRGDYEVEITGLAFDLDSLVLSRRSLLKVTLGEQP